MRYATTHHTRLFLPRVSSVCTIVQTEVPVVSYIHIYIQVLIVVYALCMYSSRSHLPMLPHRLNVIRLGSNQSKANMIPTTACLHKHSC